jgi:hypothetical protein
VTPALALLGALAAAPAAGADRGPAPAPRDVASPPADSTAPGPADVAAEPTDPDAPDDAAPDAAEPTDPDASETDTEADPDAAGPDAAADAEGPVYRVAVERSGPPFYDEADLAEVRKRHEVTTDFPPPREPARWRCLIADPTCRVTVEVVAMGAYAMRFRQGDVREKKVQRWSTGRAQYDVWVDLPALVEPVGKAKYVRMSLGPKGGVIFSDTGDLWGNLGVAGRYWFGTGRWAPALEFTSALSFKLGGRPTTGLGGDKPKFEMQRGPVGFTADVGFGLGGFGAIVLGGQYDSPLAREEVPERFRISAAGMFFIGFRGNILWGGPAAAAVVTHGVTQRVVEQP